MHVSWSFELSWFAWEDCWIARSFIAKFSYGGLGLFVVLDYSNSISVGTFSSRRDCIRNLAGVSWSAVGWKSQDKKLRSRTSQSTNVLSDVHRWRFGWGVVFCNVHGNKTIQQFLWTSVVVGLCWQNSRIYYVFLCVASVCRLGANHYWLARRLKSCHFLTVQ